MEWVLALAASPGVVDVESSMQLGAQGTTYLGAAWCGLQQTTSQDDDVLQGLPCEDLAVLGIGHGVGSSMLSLVGVHLKPCHGAVLQGLGGGWLVAGGRWQGVQDERMRLGVGLGAVTA